MRTESCGKLNIASEHLRCTQHFCRSGKPAVSNTFPSSGRTRLRVNPLIQSALVGMIIAMGQGHVRAVLPEGSDFEILGPDIQNLSWTPGVAPTAVEAEIADASAPRKGYIYVPGVSTAFDYALDHLDKLDDLTGIRIGAAYTMVNQGLTGGTGINGEPWPRYGAAGDFDIMSTWTVVGRNSENTGQFTVDGEDRFAIGARTPNSLGANIATLQPTVNTFNDRGWVVRDFFYEQRLWHGQIRFMLGRADSTDYFGSTWMQTANNSFVNRMFASGVTVNAPGHGPAVGMSLRPNDSNFYVSGGAANAYNSTTTTGFDTLHKGTFFAYGEGGWTPTFNSLGEGRYTVSGWHIGERTLTGLPADWGVTAVADQQFGSMVEAFARYGYSEAAALNVHHFWQAGIGARGLIGSTNDMTGLAFSWAFPRNDLREEKVVEAFYRAQVTRFMQLSVGAQAIIDPGDAPAHDVVGAFWGRVRFVF